MENSEEGDVAIKTEEFESKMKNLNQSEIQESELIACKCLEELLEKLRLGYTDLDMEEEEENEIFFQSEVDNENIKDPDARQKEHLPFLEYTQKAQESIEELRTKENESEAFFGGYPKDYDDELGLPRKADIEEIEKCEPSANQSPKMFSNLRNETRSSVSTKPLVKFDILLNDTNEIAPSECSTIDQEDDILSIDSEEMQKVAESRRYAGVEKFAHCFVEDVLGKSVEHTKEDEVPFRESIHESLQDRAHVGYTNIHRTPSYIRWPSAKEFNREIGEKAIENYIKTWCCKSDWLYCIDFLSEQSDPCSDFYRYEVKWSIPTKSYPIPQATTSVYFTIEVSRVKPDFCPVEISYVFEGSRFVHKAGDIAFQEYWLFAVVNAKMELYKRIRF